jgi:chorismate mutase
MPVRGVRGAVPVKVNERGAIWRATRRLALKMVEANRLKKQDIACVIFTVTPDLNADFPAYAVRSMEGGWESVPLLCAREVDVPGAMPRLVRILMLVDSDVPQRDVKHVYIGKAAKLRVGPKK